MEAAFRPGDSFQGNHGAAGPLRPERHQAGDEAERKQRDLFPHQRPPGGQAGAAGRVCGWQTGWRAGGRRPAQRPIIQQQQDQGEGDEHGFGHQSQGKQPEGGPVIIPAAAVRPVSLPAQPGFGPLEPHPIGHERQEHEESAQDILAFRNPGNGLDMQRVQREQRRHQQAAPARPGPLPEQQEEQQRVGRVEPQIHPVFLPRIKPEPLAIQHE